MTAATTIRWCIEHDEKARPLANYCVLGLSRRSDGWPCDVTDVDEESNRCLGQCGRHTVARFEAGTHGPGPYCGWCEAVPA